MGDPVYFYTITMRIVHQILSRLKEVKMYTRNAFTEDMLNTNVNNENINAV